jgi:hypothetical protein
MIAFWAYLKREYQLPAAETLLDYLRNVNPAEFKSWMTDPAKFGMAKSLLMRGASRWVRYDGPRRKSGLCQFV